jgi:hypothetical protein
MMIQGGNGQIHRFFQKLDPSLLSLSIPFLYTGKGANHYREKLKEKAEKVLDGLVKSSRFSQITRRKPSVDHQQTVLHSQISHPSLPHSHHSHHNRSLPLSSLSDKTPFATPDEKHFDATFGEGIMGMTLTKYRSKAIVSKILPNGAAETHGVKVGDYVISVADTKLEDYDEIMTVITSSSRPLVIGFKRIMKQTSPISILSSSFPRENGILHHSISDSAFQEHHIDDLIGTLESQDLSSFSSLQKRISPTSRSFPNDPSIPVANRTSSHLASFEEQQANSDSDLKVFRKSKSTGPAIVSASPSLSPSPLLDLPVKSKSYSVDNSKRRNSRDRRSSNSSESKANSQALLDETYSKIDHTNISGSAEKLTISTGIAMVQNDENPSPPTYSLPNTYSSPISSEYSSPVVRFMMGNVSANHESNKDSFIHSRASESEHDIGHILNKIDESLSDLDKLSPKYLESHDPSLDDFENSFGEKLKSIVEVLYFSSFLFILTCFSLVFVFCIFFLFCRSVRFSKYFGLKKVVGGPQ